MLSGCKLSKHKLPGAIQYDGLYDIYRKFEYNVIDSVTKEDMEQGELDQNGRIRKYSEDRNGL